MNPEPKKSSARGDSFSHLAHRILVGEKRAVLKDLAEEMGITYPSLYARLRGRVPFSAEQAALILSKVPDRRFVDFFLRKTPYIAATRADEEPARSSDGLMEDAMRALEHTVSLVRVLELGLRDAMLEQDEVSDVEDRIGEAERALATLNNRLQRCVRLQVGPCAPRDPLRQ